MSKIIGFNQNLLPLSEDNLLLNRAFYYGDGIFESIKIINGQIFQFDKHFQRILKVSKILKYDFPKGNFKEKLEANIYHVLKANQFNKGARVRLTIVRKPGGLYTPEENGVDVIIEASESYNGFEINKKGLIIETYEEIKKSNNPWNFAKTINSNLYVLASIYKKERSFDDVVIFNEEGYPIESSHGNLFIVSDEKIYTPSLDQGCIAGVMREYILENANRFGVKIYECILTVDDILNASEIFLTDAVNGIQWVTGFRKKRYYNNLTYKLFDSIKKDVAIKN
jgi:branched-chain amino acid aminotransferase